MLYHAVDIVWHALNNEIKGENHMCFCHLQSDPDNYFGMWYSPYLFIYNLFINSPCCYTSANC